MAENGPEVGVAYLTVLPSTKGFHKQLAGDVEAASTKAGQSGGKAAGSAFTAGFGKAAAGVGAAMAGFFSARAIVTGIGSTIDAGSKLAESQSKVAVVFGDSAKAVELWASTAADSMVMSTQAALEAAGTYGNLFQAFGIGQKKAMDMSTTLVQLAADLASFNNTSVDEALEAIRSGLSGEAEPLKRYGVALTDARLKQEAMAQGIFDGVGVMSAAVKSQAAYSLILKDTELAQGDVKRTGDQYANTVRAIGAAWEDMQAKVGTQIIDVVQSMGAAVGGKDGVNEMFDAMGDKIAHNIELVGVLATRIADASSADQGQQATWYETMFGALWSGASTTGPEMIESFVSAITSLGGTTPIVEDWGSAWQGVSAMGTGGAMAAIERAARDNAAAITTITDSTVEAVTGIGTLKAALEEFAGRSSLRQSGVAIREQWRALDTMGESRTVQVKVRNPNWKPGSSAQEFITKTKTVQDDFAPDISGSRFSGTASGDQARTWADELAQDYLNQAKILSAQGRSDDANALIEGGQARMARQFKEWGVRRPMAYAESYLPDVGGATASDESRRLGTATVFQFNNATIQATDTKDFVVKAQQSAHAARASRVPHGAIAP